MGKGFEKVEEEIRREKAESLGRTGERLERTLLELERLRQELMGLAAHQLPAVPDGDEDVLPAIEAKLETYARLREQARTFRSYLVIQREALGLRKHDDVDRKYPLPPPLPLPLLPRREDVR